MSELKAFRIIQGACEVYDRFEADNVIAEKDAEIVELKKQVHDYTLGLFVIQATAEKEVRHHKYKRCEALAKLCAKNIDHLNSEGYIYEKEGHTEELADCIIKTEFYDKWYHRWLELADTFKEAK